MAKKEGIRRLFDNIASDYDKLNHLLSLNIDRGWRRKGVREVVDEAMPLDILDIACGTGDFTIEIARKMPAGSHITGVDISENMMEIGRRKVAEAGVDAALLQGDCEELTFGDASFDRVTVAFGVRNFDNLQKCLSEMKRILRPGGKLVILELSIPADPVVRWFYKLYFLKLLPAIGGWISGDKAAYAYLPASVLKFPAPEKFCKMIQDAGFADVANRPLTSGICQMYIGKVK